MFGIGATEMLLILVVALLVVGPKRLPGLARSLGRSMAEFRRQANDLRHTLQEADVSESLKEAAKPPESYRIAPPDLQESGSGPSEEAKPDAVSAASAPTHPHEADSPASDAEEKGETRGG